MNARERLDHIYSVLTGKARDKGRTFVYDLNLTKAIFVDLEFLMSIPSDKYIEVANGIFDKRILSLDDLKTKEEKKAKKYLTEKDFEDNIVVLVKHKADADFIAHFHEFAETIISISGGFIGTMDGRRIYPGQSLFIERWVVHVYKPIKEGYSVILIPKHY